MKKIFIVSLVSIFSIGNVAFANDNKAVVQQAVTSKTEISPKDAKQALVKKTHVLIDVREQEEYDEVHIKDIKLIPLGNIETEAAKLNKNQKYIMVCRSGKRSKKAAEQLKSLGFNAVNMTGGMNEWQEKGYPVVKGK